jgi:hypothetical protein
MAAAAICRIVGGALVLLISAPLGIAGVLLLRRGPAASPDIIASEPATRRIARVMVCVSVLLFIAGGAAIGNVVWGGYAAAIATLVAVVAAHWINHGLFGRMRWWKTATNVAVLAIILVLLWYGYASPTE